MWRLLLLLLVLPVGVTKPATPPAAVPLPEPPAPIIQPAPADAGTRLVVNCNPPDADQHGVVAVCVYQLAPGEA